MKSWANPLTAFLPCALLLGGAACSQKHPIKPARELIQDLKDKEESARTIAAEDLGRVGSDQVPDAVRALSESLAKDESSYVRMAAAKSLGAHGANARDAVPALQKALKDSDDGVQHAAKRALEKIQGN